MKNIYRVDTSKLLNALVRDIVILVVVLAVLIVSSVSLAKEHLQNQEQERYNRYVYKSLEHIAKHFLNDFSFNLKRILLSENLLFYLKTQDREALYTRLKPQFDLLKEQIPELKILHIHRANGESFLRVHEPNKFGDNIAKRRPMLEEMHKNKTFMSGYETGLYANVYRMISPVFDEDGVYYGAVEVGLDPSFLVQTIQKITGFEGLYFINEDMKKLYKEPSLSEHFVLDGYRLQGSLSQKGKEIAAFLQTRTVMPQDEIVAFEGKEYFAHLILLKGFYGQESIKLLFFEELDRVNVFLNKTQIVVYVAIALVILVAIVLIYARVKKYQNQVTTIYMDKIEIIKDLQESLRLAVKGTHDGLWDWNLVTQEIYFSPRWKEMLGFKDDELKNIFETWKSRVHPDDLTEAVEKIEECHANPEAQYNIIHRLRHKDGRWVWVLDRGQTIFDKSGKAVRMVGFHTDISELKELEVRLENAKSQFDLFMKNAPYMVLIKNEKQEIVYRNAASFEEYENLLTKCEDEIRSLSKKALKEGVAEDVFEFEDKGTTYVFRALSFAITQVDTSIYTGEIYINISKEKLLAREIKLQNDVLIAQSRHAEMGEMISMIAHQWRQPLGVISMDVNNILADIELGTLKDESLQEELKSINEQTTHLSKTIDDFRNFFRRDKVQDYVSIEDVFMSAFNLIGKSLQNNEITIHNEFDGSLKAKVYERELQQVFINILKNAKEAMENNQTQNKRVTNKIYETPEGVVIEICDNGGGMDADVKEKIFEPYFSTKDEKNGTGLGLYMSKIIVEKHLCGSLSVVSSQDGACFKIVIPKEGSSK